jgi:hypothetical protein
MNIDEIKTFLGRVVPWHDIGIDGPYVNLHWTYQKADQKKPYWSGRACYNMVGCIDAITYAARLPDTKDIYWCVSSQKECEMRARKGNAQNGFWRAPKRSQLTASKLKVLGLDIDVSQGHANLQGKNYKSDVEALAALVKFCTDSGIPRPTMIVGTGSGGLHAYWVLAVEVDVPVWQPLANALAEATRRFNFHCDTGVTVDSARVMRMPQTVHSKHGKTAQLYTQAMLPGDYTLEDMRKALGPYMGATVIPLTPKGKVSGAADELSAGIGQYPPKNLQSVADAGCGFIKEALDTGGAAFANPLWNLTTLVATFSDGGQQDAHRMANGHPDYAPDATDELYERKVRERETKNLGWPSCASVENAGCVSCRTCTLKTPTSRPLQFGHAKSLAGPANTALKSTLRWPLPNGYIIDPNTFMIDYIGKDKKGNDILQRIADYPIMDAWLQDTDPLTLHITTKYESSPVPVQVMFNLAQAHSAEKFSAAAAHTRFALSYEQRFLMAEFVMSWIRQLQNTKGAMVKATPYGWHIEDGEVKGFCYANKIWLKDGTNRFAAPADVNTNQLYTPAGKPNKWVEASKLIAAFNSAPHDTILASAFAGPLVRFTGQEGVLIAGYSTDSGKGKTTAMKTASAVWGHAKGTLQGVTDTQVSTLGRMAELQAMPVFWDELKTDAQYDAFVGTLFNLSRGRDKSRMTQDITQRKVGMWKTLMVCCTNDPLAGHVAKSTGSTDAGLMRMFEFEVKKGKSAGTGTANDILMTKLEDNFGWAGLVYSQWLGPNADKVEADVRRTRARIERFVNAKQEERMWTSAMAVLYLGAVYSNKLGLTKIKINRLWKFLMATLEGMRRITQENPTHMRNDTDVVAVLSRFLDEHRARNTLITDNMPIGVGRVAAGSIQAINGHAQLETIHVQKAKNTKMMRIRAARLRDWLKKNEISSHAFIGKMLKLGGIRGTNAKIGAGTTDYCALAADFVYQFDLDNPELEKLLD